MSNIIHTFPDLFGSSFSHKVPYEIITVIWKYVWFYNFPFCLNEDEKTEWKICIYPNEMTLCAGSMFNTIIREIRFDKINIIYKRDTLETQLELYEYFHEQSPISTHYFSFKIYSEDESFRSDNDELPMKGFEEIRCEKDIDNIIFKMEMSNWFHPNVFLEFDAFVH